MSCSNATAPKSPMPPARQPRAVHPALDAPPHSPKHPLVQQASDIGTLEAVLGRLGLAPASLPRLFLRFERIRRLAESTRRVGVFVSWGGPAVRRGEAQHVVVLSVQAAQQLRRACTASGLRFVDNA